MNLYTDSAEIKDIDIESFLENANNNMLSPEQSLSLEGLLLFPEVSNTLTNITNNKSPGTDGFTSNFCQSFFVETGSFCRKSLELLF